MDANPTSRLLLLKPPRLCSETLEAEEGSLRLSGFIEQADETHKEAITHFGSARPLLSPI